ncbi:hypothetical protein EVAR_8898_1 [Eumeta japonica]|uniref:Uncharacterized protein n=1 Tax=Eumeta variegata TaxID=151549 RepID=A0A4C1U0K8_EUMVA|nr:hypothetical protein EVAR_8898_1 [Eumeta japonica]
MSENTDGPFPLYHPTLFSVYPGHLSSPHSPFHYLTLLPHSSLHFLLYQTTLPTMSSLFPSSVHSSFQPTHEAGNGYSFGIACIHGWRRSSTLMARLLVCPSTIL